MRKIHGLALLCLVGCAQDNKALERKLDDLTAKVVALDQKMGRAQAGQPQQRPRRPEPRPDQVFAVSVDGLPFKGPADAPVTIVEGYEYACPACNAARQAIAQTLAKYGNQVRIVYKPYIVHPNLAPEPAFAACAAHRQGKFAAMDELLWSKAFAEHDFAPARLATLAAEAGLDMDRYAKDLPKCKEAVAASHAELQNVGQGATPTFFVNGHYVVGASPASLHAIIDKELALAEQRVREGTKRAEYYQTWVIAKGEKRFEPKPAS